MRPFLLAFLALAPAFAGAARAQQAPAREAVIANDTDGILQELYVFRPGAGDGPDRLGSGVLPPRAMLRVPLGRVRECGFEARAVFEGGEEMRRRFDACRNPRVAFAETGPRRAVEVVNGSDRVLRELYLAPAGSRPGRARDWGADRLGSDTVAVGESFRLRLRGTTACSFDIRAVYDDDEAEIRERQDLCRSPRLAFGDPNQPLREATVSNRGRRTLRELYARPAGSEGWGADRLGAEVVPARGEFRLRLRGRGCAFDLRAVYEDSREEVQRGLDLCTSGAASFGLPVVSDSGGRRVTLLNGFSRTVQQAFLSPADADDWGEDVLGDAVIAPGARQAVTLQGGCQADLRIVFDTDAAEERRDIDICALGTIALRPGWTIDPLVAPAAEPRGPQPGSIRLRNAAGLPVVELYADPPGNKRGADRLGRTVLGAGEVMDFAPPEGPEQCLADLVAVFRNGRELALPDTDLCAGREVVLQ
ncbi:hypothetical protein [Belnapia rosea]|uniref:hypothetical protein n=1 Tax=Belnapia rosea TaxID=938405 RepID=UPI000886422B|nr:hypothetical protein [Belnapia rosea]SDB30837.1 hypothetical protein SAMN02927895_01056 [Belnapia rosea]